MKLVRINEEVEFHTDMITHNGFTMAVPFSMIRLNASPLEAMDL